MRDRSSSSGEPGSDPESTQSPEPGSDPESTQPPEPVSDLEVTGKRESESVAAHTPPFRSCDDESEDMRRTLPRRRLLAAVAVPGLLAGCLVESADVADGSEDEESGAADASSTRQTEDETDDEADDLPDEVGPDGSGLVVTDATVLDVTDDGTETMVRARLTVENAGRFTYGTVEFRVDAHAAPPHSGDRDAVGYAYVTRRFPSGDRFDDGTRNVEVTIAFRSQRSRSRADPNWYEVDAAVRRAEPS